MAKVTVYTMDYCPFCDRAKALLKQKNIPFEEIKVSQDDDKTWDDLEKRTGMKTMPQIFHGDDVIGGCSELEVLLKKPGVKLG